eukprot:15435776-Alexandrium_andersonii.AAC.1
MTFPDPGPDTGAAGLAPLPKGRGGGGKAAEPTLTRSSGSMFRRIRRHGILGRPRLNRPARYVRR